MSQIDLFASMAELVGQEMQSGAGVDSQNQLKAFWELIVRDVIM